MAQGTVLPAPVFQGLTAAGAVAAGGKLYCYVAGTTTLQNTFSDVGLTTPNANPIILDSAGRTGPVFLSPTTYKFKLTDSADVTIWTADNISAVPTLGADTDVSAIAGTTVAAGQAVYLSDGSGGLNAGQWYLCDGDAAATSTSALVVGVALAAIATAATGTVRLVGRVTGLSGLTAGATYYASGTAGALTATAPTFARVLGVADTTTTLILSSRPAASTRAIIVGIGSPDGSAITTGVKAYVPIPFACTITGWTLVADASGSIVIDVWKDSYANFPPTVADTIAGSEKPTLSTAQKNQDSSLTTWTTAVSANDVLGFKVDSATTVKHVVLTLTITL
jgi:hypothetical protein